MTIQELRGKEVNLRHNWIMWGVTISLLGHIPKTFGYIILLTLVNLALLLFISKMRLLDSVTMNSFLWMFWGYGVIGAYNLFIFVLCFMSVLLVYAFLKHFILKWKGQSPFYIAVLGAYILSCYYWSLY